MAEEPRDDAFEDDDEEEATTAGELPLPGGNFQLFVSKLGFQALIALGIYENPVTRRTDRNLGHARMVIDDLRMLKEKTKGNLERDEEAHLGKVISDLQFHFVRATDEESGSAGERGAAGHEG